MKHRFMTAAASFFAALLSTSTSYAIDGLAKPWQLGFSTPMSPVMEWLNTTHNYLLILITAISLFVLFLLIYICVRFNRKTNPVPSKNAHNIKLEVIWTVVPILILIAIAIPSLRLHYFMEDDVEPEMTLKVVGYQWYWHYDYPDFGGFGFDSYLKKKEELGEGEHRLLAVDNHVVVPVDTKIRVLLTAGDVIHAWALPVFGVKRDAMPGRLNSTWFKANKTGRFYGQCSELCGVGHGFMPIVVDVVSKEDFKTWVFAKQQEAGIDPASVQPSNADTEHQKIATPETTPVSSEHENPKKIIEEEKERSGSKNTDPKDKQPQAKPAEAAQKVKEMEQESEPEEPLDNSEDMKNEEENNE